MITTYNSDNTYNYSLETDYIDRCIKPLEKIKMQIDPIIDKIDWISLSQNIKIDKDILAYYDNHLKWDIIGLRLIQNSI